MKRIIAALLVLVTVLGLCACGEDATTTTGGQSNNNVATTTKPAVQPTVPPTVPPTTQPQKSDAVINAEKLIDDLGEITLDSEAALNAAQSAVDALTKQDRQMVENMDKLESAWETYKQLCNEAAAEVIEQAIAGMGDATYKNRQNVIDTMKLYNSADAKVKACVDNADVLMEAAATVAKAMLGKMAAEEDFVRNMAFYYHSQWPRGKEYWYADERCFALPYLGKQGNDVWLRFVCNYTRRDWVFFKKITFACYDQRFYKSFSYYDVVRDNSGGRVWEYIDMDVNATEIKILEAIASSEKTIIRFEGDDYYYDFTVTTKDKEAIRFTLDLYYLLGGK